jgi:16S rRNA (adenine1518-N6/adenine1519-N6)-dimethyltransferase
LQEQGLFAKKHLSQNFLIDGNILQKIKKSAQITENDLVLEIGPGPGALTQLLLGTGASVIAIEKDPAFAALLSRLQTKDNRLKVFEADILQFPIENWLKTHLKQGQKIKVVANLPYHITTPILVLLLPFYELIDSLTLMVQKEVAERFVAKVGSKDYSSFAVFLSYFSKVYYHFSVAPTCFSPQPKVHSAVVQLFPIKPILLSSIEDFFKLTRTAFQQRRKMLSSSLRKLYAKESLEKALVQTGLPLTARPQELSLEQFIALFQCLA